MTLNEVNHGFVVQREVALPELNAVLMEMEHTQTGLKLVWLKRDEENKTFGIAFTTLPWDDTGVFHILEHSVLCGSKKYPVKEPFVELLKTSMNTFLNALTFPDKTVYPISSRNHQDFFNLMRVYLDAVFCPSIYEKPEIFRQEGWHYELDEQGNATYKGVVFNEMKGAMADADELASVEIGRALFPDTSYRYVSGGDPISIPDLTYEQFIHTHEKCYSPSNAYVFLDGDIAIDETLSVISEYLEGRGNTGRMALPAQQPPVLGGERVVSYEISEEDDPEGKMRLMNAGVIGDYSEREKLVAMQILSRLLCGSNQSPLSAAILNEGLAEDVQLDVQDGVAQTWCCLSVRNFKEENREKIETIIKEKLQSLASEGLNREELEAVMANLEFQMRERDYGSYPQGLIFGFQILESWLYGGKPEANLEIGTLFDDLRKKCDEGYFEQLIREVLLESKHCCTILMTPSRTEGEKRRAAESERIAGEVAEWDDAAREKVIAEKAALDAWQNSQDTPRQLATLPHLDLSDLKPTPEEIPTECVTKNGIPYILHEVNTAGIAYVSLWFDAADLTSEEISTLSYMSALLGQTETAEHTPEDIIRLQRLICGSMAFAVQSFACGEKTKILFNASFSTLEKNLNKALELCCEILTSSRPREDSNALSVLQQERESMMQQIIMSGASAAIGRVAASVLAASAVTEYAGGYSYFQWVKAQEKNWGENGLEEKMKAILSRIICLDRLTVSITSGNAEALSDTMDAVKTLLPQGKCAEGDVKITPMEPSKEGIVIPADISFAVCGGNYKKHGGKWNGAMMVASKILSLEYLWNVVRVQGGAYGSGFLARPGGFVGCYSYRDPNASGSLDSFKKSGEFLASFVEEKEDLSGYIIGTVSDASPLMTPRTKGSTGDSQYWSGITWEKRCERYQAMIHTNKEQLKAFAKLFTDTLNDSGFCVVGSREQIEKTGADNILSL